MPSKEGWSYCCWWMWDLRTFAQFQGSKMSLGLFQDFMEAIQNIMTFLSSSCVQSLWPLLTNLEDPSSVPAFSQFLILVLSYLCSVRVGAWNYDPSWGIWQCLLLRLKSQSTGAGSTSPSSFYGQLPNY